VKKSCAKVSGSAGASSRLWAARQSEIATAARVERVRKADLHSPQEGVGHQCQLRMLSKIDGILSSLIHLLQAIASQHAPEEHYYTQ